MNIDPVGPGPRRRALLLGGLGALSQPPALHGADAERSRPPADGDRLVFSGGTAAGQVVTPGDVRAGHPPLRVWPMQPSLRVIRDGTRFNQILLLRLTAVDSGGIAAYSAICTHAGCAVSGWNGASGLLLCPCHGSSFAADHDGAVVSGPASRPLPALQTRSVNGVLIVASAFSGRIGGDTSRTM